MREFNLISAPFSCGISWLVSVLMELGVRTTHAEPRRYPHGFWIPAEGKGRGERIVPEGVAHLRYYIPLLHRQEEFLLEPGLEVLWEHRLDFARHAGRPTILFVRDPRDAIRSIYERNYLHFGWHEYLRRPDLWEDHFPGMFGLPPGETWAAWHAMWLGLQSQAPFLVLRFEESRQHPVQVVDRVLEFLGVRRSPEAVRQAVGESTVERARTAMERSEESTGEAFRVVGRGKVGGWSDHFDEEALQLFGGPAADWMRRLGYEPAPVSERAGDGIPAIAPGGASSGTVRLLAEADRLRTSGDPASAAARLLSGVLDARQAGLPPGEELLLTVDRVAWDWTGRVLGPEAHQHPSAPTIFASFQGFLRRHALWPSVSAMLRGSITAPPASRSDVFGRLDSAAPKAPSPSPGDAPRRTAGAPLLVEEDYHGYELLGYNGRFYAVARAAAAGLDLTRLGRSELAAERASGRVFSGDLPFEVKAAVDRFLAQP
ncbi:MAG TPA: hypothetical protein DCM86_10595 [Verrucomicrobiales bacterium]|nr:hypothetical protein [Verrucomicrobiales bacterium]